MHLAQRLDHTVECPFGEQRGQLLRCDRQQMVNDAIAVGAGKEGREGGEEVDGFLRVRGGRNNHFVRILLREQQRHALLSSKTRELRQHLAIKRTERLLL